MTGQWPERCPMTSPSGSRPIPKVLEKYAPVYARRQAMYQAVNGAFADKTARVENFLREAIQRCDFAMCVRAEDLEGILRDDRVKSMFETGHGASVGGEDARREWMQRMYGVDAGELAPEDHPTYGLLVGRDRVRDLARDPDPFYRYGAAMLVLRKESLMARTTMTVGSSFDFMESILKSPVPVTDPKALCIKGFPTDLKLAPPRWFNGLLFFDDLIVQGRLSPDLPNCLAMAAEDMMGFENFELQFFGPIVFSRDVTRVEYLNVTGREAGIVEGLRPKLESLGIGCGDVLEGLPSFF